MTASAQKVPVQPTRAIVKRDGLFLSPGFWPIRCNGQKCPFRSAARGRISHRFARCCPPGLEPNDVGRITPIAHLSRDAPSWRSSEFSIHAPAMGYTKGLWIPLSERYNEPLRINRTAPSSAHWAIPESSCAMMRSASV